MNGIARYLNHTVKYVYFRLGEGNEEGPDRVEIMIQTGFDEWHCGQSSPFVDYTARIGWHLGGNVRSYGHSVPLLQQPPTHSARRHTGGFHISD